MQLKQAAECSAVTFLAPANFVGVTKWAGAMGVGATEAMRNRIVLTGMRLIDHALVGFGEQMNPADERQQ